MLNLDFLFDADLASASSTVQSVREEATIDWLLKMNGVDTLEPLEVIDYN